MYGFGLLKIIKSGLRLFNNQYSNKPYYPKAQCPVTCDYSVSFLGLCWDLGCEGLGLELGLDHILEGHIHIFILLVRTEKLWQNGATLCTLHCENVLKLKVKL